MGIIAVAIGLSSLGLFPAGAQVPLNQVFASADRSLLNNYCPAGGCPDRNVTLATVSFPLLGASESRLIIGRILATNATTSTNILQNAKIICKNAAGADVGGVRAQTSENHVGSSKLAGGNYPAKGQLATAVNWLLKPGVAGSYSCSLVGEARSTALAPGASALTALKSGTYIKYSNRDELGAGQWLPNVCPGGNGPRSNGTTGCVYLGKSGWTFGPNDPIPQSRYALYGDGAPGLYWIAPMGVVALEAIGDVSVTTCYYTTNSCIDEVKKWGKDPATGKAYPNSTIDAQLRVDRIDSTGHSCEVATYPPGAYERTAVTNDAHHQKLHLHLSRWVFNKNICKDPVTQMPSMRFIVRVHVKYVSGNPFFLEGQENSTILTNGIIMNLFS